MSDDDPDAGRNAETVGELRTLIEAIERLQENKAEIADMIAERFAEAKSRGFDVKALRRAIKRRGMTDAQRSAADDLDDLAEFYSEIMAGQATFAGEWPTQRRRRAERDA